MKLDTLLRLLSIIRDAANKLKDSNQIVYALDELIDQIREEGITK